MTPSPVLLIHAGMRPGELILAIANEKRPVFLPATDRVHRFEIGKHPQAEEWALLRRYLSGNGEAEALFTFDNEEEATRALDELHAALLEPAPITLDRPGVSFSLPENWKPIAAAALFIALMIGLSYCGKRPAASDNTAATPSTPTIDYSAPIGPPAPNEATTPPSAAPGSGALSPGDAILQQIQQTPPATAPAPQPAAPQAIAPQAPASAGDALLRQIKGG